MATIDSKRLYIHGEYTPASSQESFETVNPATGEVICEVQVAHEKDVDRAVDSAREGQRTWAATPVQERGRILMKAVGLLRARNQDLAELEVMDTGKAISEAISVDIVTGADCIEYFAGVMPSIGGESFDHGTAFSYTRLEPIGVCAGIGAWNYPLQIACWKSGPALACGNSMIFKPSELTPLSALKLAEIYTEAGVPDGVFNVVQGDGTVGALLSSHPEIRKVSLTGSVSTGKKIMAAAAETLKHVSLELGGKSPLIIFSDTDLDVAVRAAMTANFLTQGEICANGTRVFVERSIHDAFIQKLIARTRQLRVGNPMDPQTQVGALISHDHLNKVLAYIASAKASGAQLLCGGGRHPVPGLVNGSFMEPTVFGNCTDEMKHVQEEIFGPVMSVLSFENEAEVIERANNTQFGLAAAVFTRDINRAHCVIAQLEAGTCWINTYHELPISMPFGGYKQSGVGRENGRTVIEHYTQIKSVYVETGEMVDPFGPQQIAG